MTKFLESLLPKFPWINVNTGLLVLRIGVGSIFILSGWMKVSDMTSTVGFFSALGFSAFWAYLASYVEFLGGIIVLLGLGVYTRMAAKLLAIVMLVAMYLLRSDLAAIMTPFMMFFSASAILFAGPGKYSVLKEGKGDISSPMM
jgi:putative oxidoreductase